MTSTNPFLNTLLANRHFSASPVLGWEVHNVDFVATRDKSGQDGAEEFSYKVLDDGLPGSQDYRGAPWRYCPKVVGQIYGPKIGQDPYITSSELCLGLPVGASPAMTEFYTKQITLHKQAPTDKIIRYKGCDDNLYQDNWDNTG
ncbi:hypothetical protein C8J57DRAFT_1236058 [Mycena rebaudengoi]|nr:hypothetical protein C8J57DRAFT_1236058 [Mycena rebaudengoi]